MLKRVVIYKAYILISKDAILWNNDKRRFITTRKSMNIRDWIRKEINYIHFLYQVRCIAIESYFVNNQSDLKAFNVSIRLFVIS